MWQKKTIRDKILTAFEPTLKNTINLHKTTKKQGQIEYYVDLPLSVVLFAFVLQEVIQIITLSFKCLQYII